MLSMVSGSRGFAANPLDGADFPVRAGAPAGGDDHRLHRRPLGRAARADAVRDRGGAAGVERDAVARRLGGEAAVEEVRDSSLMASQPATAGLGPSAKPRSKPRDSIRSWPLTDRIAYGLCWAAGIALCVIAAMDRAVHGDQGHLLPETEPARAVARRLAEPERLGRLPRPDRGHVPRDRDRHRRWRRRSAWRWRCG